MPELLKEVKRYSPLPLKEARIVCQPDDAAMVEDENGEWVLYADLLDTIYVRADLYDAQAKEIERLNAQLDLAGIDNATQAGEIELLKGLINEVLLAKEDGAFDWAVWDRQAVKAL